MTVKKNVSSSVLISLCFLILTGGFFNAVYADDTSDPYKISADPVFQKLRDEIEKNVDKWKKQKEKGTDVKETRKEIREALEKLEKETKFLTDDAKAKLYSALLVGATGFYKPSMWLQLYMRYRGAEGAPFRDSKSTEWSYLDGCYKRQKEVLDRLNLNTNDQLSFRDCSQGMHTLEKVVSSGPYSMRLVGDGVNTGHCSLEITNTKSGKIRSTLLTTVCSSTRNHLPPQPAELAKSDDVHYTIGNADPENVAIVEASRLLSRQGKYDNLDLKDAEAQIRQLAIWKRTGELSKDEKNAVTQESIKTKIVGKTALTPEQNLAVDEKVKELFGSVNLTLKEAKRITANDPPDNSKNPEDTGRPGEPVTQGQSDLPQPVGSVLTEQGRSRLDADPNKANQLPEQPVGSVLPEHARSWLNAEPYRPNQHPDYVSLSAGGAYVEACIPPATSFIPDKPQYQTMDTIEEQVAQVPISTDEPPPTTTKEANGDTTQTFYYPNGKPRFSIVTDAKGHERYTTHFYESGKTHFIDEIDSNGYRKTTSYHESGNIESVTIRSSEDVTGKPYSSKTKEVTTHYPDKPPIASQPGLPFALPKRPAPDAETTFEKTNTSTFFKEENKLQTDTYSVYKTYRYTKDGAKYLALESFTEKRETWIVHSDPITIYNKRTTKTYKGPDDKNPKVETEDLGRWQTPNLLPPLKKLY